LYNTLHMPAFRRPARRVFLSKTAILSFFVDFSTIAVLKFV